MSPRHMIKFSIASVLAAAAGQALAAEQAPPPDTSRWTCSACPFDKGYQADATLGAFYADGANADSGRYTGIDSKKTYVDAAARGTYAGTDGQFASYAIDNLGLDSRSAAIKLGQYGHYDVALHYDGLPYPRYDATVTPYSGGSVQTLPAGWVVAGTPAGMTDLAASLHKVDIGTLRKTYGLSGRWLAGHGLTVFASFDRQKKTGSQIVGASFLAQAVQLAAPVAFTTDTFEVGVSGASKSFSWRLSASDAKFKNDDPLLTFQNPYPLLDGLAAYGAVSRPPESKARSFNATVSAALPLNSSVSFAGGYSKLTQSAALLPVTTAPGATPPASGFDGQVKISHFALTLGSRPMSRLQLHGRVAYDDRKDDSNALSLTQYVTDMLAGPTLTTPRFNFERLRMDGGADLRLLHALTVGIGGDRIEINRTQQIVRHTEDGRTYGKFRWTPRSGFSLTLKAGGAHREARGINLSYLPVGQNPLVSMLNLANRDRRFVDLDAIWAATDKLSIALQGSKTNDSYGRSTLGLRSGEERRAGATLSWTPTEQLSFYLDGGYQARGTVQEGGYSTSSAVWGATIKDKFRNMGLGFKYAIERWDYALDLAHSTSIGETSVGALGFPAAYPDLGATYDEARFSLGYAATERLTLRLRYIYLNHSSLDWALDGVGPATSYNLLALGASPGFHNVNIYGLSFNYRFGASAAP